MVPMNEKQIVIKLEQIEKINFKRKGEKIKYTEQFRDTYLAVNLQAPASLQATPAPQPRHPARAGGG